MSTPLVPSSTPPAVDPALISYDGLPVDEKYTRYPYTVTVEDLTDPRSMPSNWGALIRSGAFVYPDPPCIASHASWPKLTPPWLGDRLMAAAEAGDPSPWTPDLQALYDSVSPERWEELYVEVAREMAGCNEWHRRSGNDPRLSSEYEAANARRLAQNRDFAGLQYLHGLQHIHTHSEAEAPPIPDPQPPLPTPGSSAVSDLPTPVERQPFEGYRGLIGTTLRQRHI